MITMSDFLKQLNQESTTTRKMLKLVPEDKWDWKPHAKSMSIRSLATHVAELPTWIPLALSTDYLDFAENPYNPVKIESNAQLVEYFEDCLKQGQEALQNTPDSELDKPWTLRNGDTIFSTAPKRDMVQISISQIIHHRAQLGVYLRLLDIPIPGSYGPSADEMPLN